MVLYDYIPSWETVAKTSFGTALVMVGGTMGALYYGQSALIYPSGIPQDSRTTVAVPTQYGMPYDDIDLITPDNVKLKAYLMLNGYGHDDEKEVYSAARAMRRPTVFLLHANAGNMGHRLPLASIFYNKMHCNVFMLSYRGYGQSEGTPSEKGIRIDAETALQYITKHPVLKDTKIFLYGQSLGGAVALDLASRYATLIHAVIVENTFLSIPKLIPTVLPLLSPFSFLCHQIWDSETRIPFIPSTTPMLFLAGKRDELVHPTHMKRLYELACATEEDQNAPAVVMGGVKETDNGGIKLDVDGERRVWWDCERGTHNDTCAQPGYWETVRDFVSRWR
ncbi:alpha/beta-hydrolase [Dacryopinax primogenitus]|uniref:Alpha/beta-hydrolase n=1 Tax=Dacryopinax primogenitus (strain DJM 731) TaxID=1858805 RepID=M5FV82_DACPD|nr:alpha/beta-hydrolase [Dacryopinax primogenitus]EJT99519.1 alpha/beta-hydrolase [Dacryopinax primogenitus]